MSTKTTCDSKLPVGHPTPSWRERGQYTGDHFSGVLTRRTRGPNFSKRPRNFFYVSLSLSMYFKKKYKFKHRYHIPTGRHMYPKNTYLSWLESIFYKPFFMLFFIIFKILCYNFEIHRKCNIINKIH